MSFVHGIYLLTFILFFYFIFPPSSSTPSWFFLYILGRFFSFLFLLTYFIFWQSGGGVGWVGICILHSLFWFGHWFLFFGIDVAQHSLGVLCCVLFFRSRRGLSYFIYFFTEGLGVSRIGTLKMLRYPVLVMFSFFPPHFCAENGWVGRATCASQEEGV